MSELHLAFSGEYIHSSARQARSASLLLVQVGQSRVVFTRDPFPRRTVAPTSSAKCGMCGTRTTAPQTDSGKDVTSHCVEPRVEHAMRLDMGCFLTVEERSLDRNPAKRKRSRRPEPRPDANAGTHLLASGALVLSFEAMPAQATADIPQLLTVVAALKGHRWASKNAILQRETTSLLLPPVPCPL
ncbi:hypothetical protein HaLaN_00568, partial [Haematococcus lacustris]